MLGAEELSGSLEENIRMEGFSWIKERQLLSALTVTCCMQPKLGIGGSPYLSSIMT